jgi:hypothetical protein
MINQRPQRVFFFSLGPGLSEPFDFDSTFAASESHTFSRGSRRNCRDGAYRYDVFQITLCHLYVYKFTSDLNFYPRFKLAFAAESERRSGFLVEEMRILLPGVEDKVS